MAECAEIVDLFKQHDANGDGTIDEAELTAVMSGIGFTEEDCKKMFSEADMNKDGVIKYEEFVAWVFSDDLEEETPEGESAAPFMKQAFELLTKGITDLAAAAMEEGGDLEAAMANEQAMQEQFVELLGKSFDHHNTSGSGTLDPEEAKKFFSNLVAQSGAFLEAIVTISIKKFMQVTVKTMIEAMSEGGDEASSTEPGVKMAMVSAMREGLNSELEKAKVRTAQQLEEYLANKEERDEAAFKVIDVDGTGSIGKEEFLAAFTPGNDKSDEVMAALGIETPEEPEMPAM